ncbi:MAG: nucleolar complex protein 14 [Alectoria fallacina]|uniref:Nucleolar complex protein 14 n=1 Tax=Alectoria fallacina TaxID=1903189 RepID=A0A8H3IHS0_9LECA|nr:MAG: nucleolar complex protein 14 [Alectoria fallacina]
MPPSQLKRLKNSLREQGVVGPQKSKKQRKQASKNGALKDSRIQRNAALQAIREQFNPFEVKGPSRSKYEFTSNRTIGGQVEDGTISRPGVTKGLGEENRRKTLLVEMQRRKKVGGIMDRRFGENDPTMTPEEKALERFVKEKQKGSKKGSLFDLEDAEENEQLTHFGESLSFDKPDRLNDFHEADLGHSDDDLLIGHTEERPRKRPRLSDTDSSEDSVEENGVRLERPKTKKEVMKEVIAKSKLHKYERQQAKEDDDELRAELDKGLPDLFALMRGNPTPPQPPPALPKQSSGMNPDRMALLKGKDRSQADKEYDERLRQMAMDQRAKPTERTLTDEEKLQHEAQRLEELEVKRLRRMRGETEDSESDSKEIIEDVPGKNDLGPTEGITFGLGPGLLGQHHNRHLDVEDEDDFIIEDDLLASGSDVDLSDNNGPDVLKGESSDDSDEQEFVQGLLSKEDAGREGLSSPKGQNAVLQANGVANDLAYTYECPKNHEEFLAITKSIAIQNLPTVVQRIRALYHPKLADENKVKLGTFATILVDHISHLACQADHPPFVVLEALVRHVHSLAKTFPGEIGGAFRTHLRSFYEDRPNAPTPGDLIILTAIASTFPTSDHFHQVVTPAMLCMTRYIGQKVPQTLNDLATGSYISTLCLQYQRLSKRYVPEVVNYVLNAVWALCPVEPAHLLGLFPHHSSPDSLRIHSTSDAIEETRQLSFWDVVSTPQPTDADNQQFKIALIETHIAMIETMAELWAEKSAFCEVFAEIYSTLRFLQNFGKLNDKTREEIRTVAHKVHEKLLHSQSARQFLRLHRHRPLAIKTSIPKFEESYNPDKHYDPDHDRAEVSKLKAEHKRERKGAMRELRKDANFITRESLKEKKERDSAYEKKYKRLVAEIQGEEGRESKNYERERRMRKGRQ